MPPIAWYLKYVYLASLLVLAIAWLWAWRQGRRGPRAAFVEARARMVLFLAMAWVVFALAMVRGEARIMAQDWHLMRDFTPEQRLAMLDAGRVGTRPDFFQFMEFVKRKTPQDAKLLLLARNSHPGNRARYYLYPRALWWYRTPSQVNLASVVHQADISYAVILGYPGVEIRGMRRWATFSPDEYILRRSDEP